VVVAIEGGVDSSVAAALMKQQGYEVIGVTMTLSPHDAKPTPGARGCCSVWDVPTRSASPTSSVSPHTPSTCATSFSSTSSTTSWPNTPGAGTPNPCRRCNQHIKFDHLLRRALDLGAEKVVTGHYARIDFDAATGRYRLLQGKDARKDQSYVLASLTRPNGCTLPIRRDRKSHVREAGA